MFAKSPSGERRTLTATMLSMLLILGLLSSSSVLSVKANLVTWYQTYGGSSSEFPNSLVATSDGGYAIVGYVDTTSNNLDVWLVKTDAYGNMEWNKTYGEETRDRAYSLVQASDGGYVFAGVKGSFGWLVKVDAYGNVEWSRTYDGAAYSLVATSDGGYAFAGYVEVHGRSWDGAAYSLVATSDGGFAFAGHVENEAGWTQPSSTQCDALLVKTDAYGNMEWNKTYSGSSGSSGMTSDGQYPLTENMRDDFWVVKTDAFGNMEWNKIYGGTYDEWAYSLVEASDGGYAVAGYTQSFGAGDDESPQFQSLYGFSSDFWLVKTDAFGNMQWQQTYGGKETDRARALIATSDGGYALAGNTVSFGDASGTDILLIKTDEIGFAPEPSWIVPPIEVPDALPAERTLLLDKAKVVLNDLVGINLTDYTIYDVDVRLVNESISSVLLNPGLPKETVLLRLNSSQGSLRAQCQFVNGKLCFIFLTEYAGSVSFNRPMAGVVDMAKSFLENYQVYTGNPFYGELGSVLDTVTGEEDTTRTMGDVRFEYQNYDTTLEPGIIMDSFTWTYTSSGVVAATDNLGLEYRDGQLRAFRDYIQFTTLSGEPKLSGEEAMATALRGLRDFSYDVNTDGGVTTVSQFNIAQVEQGVQLLSLSYVESGVSDGVIFQRPAWAVGIGFDKHYPGYVTGVIVRIWADTGNLDSISPTYIGGVPLINEPPDTTVPSITVLSPENKSYATNSISLNFATSEPVSWVDYSLNGGPNVTITDRYITTSGNIQLTGLPLGSNTLKIYAGDTYGSTANIGASDTIHFNIAKITEPKPSTTEPKPIPATSEPESTQPESTQPESTQPDSEDPESHIVTSEPTLTEPEPKDAFPTTSAVAIVASVTIVIIAAALFYSKKRDNKI